MEQITKNSIYKVHIDGYSSDGSGVCRIDGRAVFVPGTIAGEDCEVKILRATRNAVYAKCEKLLSPSPFRVEPSCGVFGKCGGCDTMHMSYEEELRFKLSRVNDALRRIGGIPLEISEIIPSDETEAYRNKVIFNVSGTAEGLISGFYRKRSHDIVSVSACSIQPKLSNRIAAAVLECCARNSIIPYDEASGKGALRHIFVRHAFGTRQTQLVLISARGFGALTQVLVSELRSKIPELSSIVLCINKQRGNTVLSGELHTLWGTSSVTETLCGLNFEISPFSFFQINPRQAEKLYERAIEYASPSGTETVLDLYCGAGTISLCLARRAAHVIGAEIVPEAVENARRNAAANGISNVEFICADAGKAAEMLIERDLRPDTIVVDPPRKGLSQEIIDSVDIMSPSALVYVSCDPATLSRDLALLSSRGWIAEKGTAVDMFPRTSHVETVVLLSRKTPNDVIHVDLELDELDVTAAEAKATYQEIKDYVLEKYGFKVSQLYIAQVKRKHGIIERENYNKPKSEDAKVPQCPPEKEKAIEDALRHFEML